MHEPEKAEGRPHGPQPEEAATQAISQIGTSVTHAVIAADIRDRRRASRELDDLLGIVRPVTDVSDIDMDWYHVTGLDLGYVERQPAAGVAG